MHGVFFVDQNQFQRRGVDRTVVNKHVGAYFTSGLLYKRLRLHVGTEDTG